MLAHRANRLPPAPIARGTIAALATLATLSACTPNDYPLAAPGMSVRGGPRVLLVGDSAPLPAGDWRSSDTNIATVDGTVVRGRRYGAAVLSRADPRDSLSFIVTPPVLIGAGDVASCGMRQDEETARILDTIPGVVFTAGDNVYPSGSAEQFARCYTPTWGRHLWRTFPSPGNHDYKTRRARPYFDYFGARAGERGRGWYSYDIGAWHVIMINSVVDVSRDSPQLTWLARDLAATRDRKCTVAVMHSPRYSEGPHGSSVWMQPLWHALYEGGVDIVIAGHDHQYERFAPMNASGKADPARGMREFVVGTGGRNLYRVERRIATSEAQIDDQHGVLRLELGDGRYRWAFITAPSGVVRDSGEGRCR